MTLARCFIREKSFVIFFLILLAKSHRNSKPVFYFWSYFIIFDFSPIFGYKISFLNFLVLTTKNDKTGFFLQSFVFLWCNLWNKIPSFIPLTPTIAKKKKEDAIQLTLNMTFCPTPRPLTHKQPKQSERTTIAPTDSEHKFHKTGVKNWLPIGFGLGRPPIGYLLL